MHATITEDTELTALLERTRRFREEIAPLASEMEWTARVPDEVRRQMGELGYFGLTIPKEYGGLGLGLVGYVAVMGELSKSHPAVGGLIALNNMVSSRAVLYGGTEEQRRRFLPPIASGEQIVAFGLTEPNAGSDAAGIETQAVWDGDTWVLSGKKHLIMHAPIAEAAVIVARTPPEEGGRGFSAFLVDAGTPGFVRGEVQDAMSSRTMVGEILLEDCRVPGDRLLGEPGTAFSAIMRALDATRAGVSAYCVGSAQRALELAVEHVKRREQFGKPIADFQGVQWMLAEMAADVQTIRFAQQVVCARIDAGEPVPGDAAILKLKSSEMACRVADQALQLMGGAGYMTDNEISRIYRDVRIWRIVDGTSEMQKTVIARDVLAHPERYV